MSVGLAGNLATGGIRGRWGRSKRLMGCAVKPERCLRCQPPLAGEDPVPQRHQVTDIPPVKPVVTEYQLHQLVCPVCGDVSRAELPAGVPTGGFGPRVQAITALCTGAYHLSKRTTQSVLEDLFGVSNGDHRKSDLARDLGRPLRELSAA